jgi:uncharacterized membrane protein
MAQKDVVTRTERRLGAIFFAGLFALLPIVVTIALVVWLVATTEAIFSDILRLILPGSLYLPGMGLLVATLLIFGAGLAMQGFVSRQILSWVENSLSRIPLVKSIYGSVRDLTELMSNHDEERFGGVVMVQIPEMPVKLIGFVTLRDLGRFGLGVEDDAVAVYLPMSYQIGGYTLFISRRYLTPVAMSIEDAMRFAVTAGVSHGGLGRRQSKPPSADSSASQAP